MRFSRGRDPDLRTPGPPPDAETAREIAWTPAWDPDRRGWGVELLRFGARHATSSAILFDGDGLPYELSYRIEWDARWHVRFVRVIAAARGEVRSVRIRSDGEGSWRDAAGAELEDVAGCLDVDIWPTPFTNSFPIRRLQLRVGERSEVRSVYIEAPRLTISATDQAYTRLAEDRFLFEAEEGEFRAELRVDQDGIVLDYPGLFRRLA